MSQRAKTPPVSDNITNIDDTATTNNNAKAGNNMSSDNILDIIDAQTNGDTDTTNIAAELDTYGITDPFADDWMPDTPDHEAAQAEGLDIDQTRSIDLDVESQAAKASPQSAKAPKVAKAPKPPKVEVVIPTDIAPTERTKADDTVVKSASSAVEKAIAEAGKSTHAAVAVLERAGAIAREVRHRLDGMDLPQIAKVYVTADRAGNETWVTLAAATASMDKKAGALFANANAGKASEPGQRKKIVAAALKGAGAEVSSIAGIYQNTELWETYWSGDGNGNHGYTYNGKLYPFDPESVLEALPEKSYWLSALRVGDSGVPPQAALSMMVERSQTEGVVYTTRMADLDMLAIRAGFTPGEVLAGIPAEKVLEVAVSKGLKTGKASRGAGAAANSGREETLRSKYSPAVANLQVAIDRAYEKLLTLTPPAAPAAGQRPDKIAVYVYMDPDSGNPVASKDHPVLADLDKVKRDVYLLLVLEADHTMVPEVRFAHVLRPGYGVLPKPKPAA